ncbi:MAG: sigma-54 dependent transcriptional regulator [Desulfobacterales bacterium]
MISQEERKFSPLNILIVDDETNIRKTLSCCLSAEGHSVSAVSNTADARGEAGQHAFDMAFVDLKLGWEDGMELIPVLLSDSPWMKIVVITAYASIGSAVEAMRRGAADYIAKPFTPDQIRLLTQRIGKIRELENEIAVLKENMGHTGPVTRLQSLNPGMQRVIETAKKVADSDATVLLLGESGTGKSVFAKAIHQWSPRSTRPLSVAACPAMPPDLLESEFFGHVKGAFTGAVRDYPGRIAACEGGTLFLDEIADIPASMQAKMLRFLQDREYERLGEARTRKADVRIIAATNADLAERAARGHFREDLFYRLNVISLTIPPLRERPEDIMPLARDFLTGLGRLSHKPILGFAPDAEQILQHYSWPGNVRELHNAIERAVILGTGERIGGKDLPDHIVPAADVPAIGDPASLAKIEELHIRRVISRTASLQEAANILGIDQATLWRRRKLYGI